MARLVADPGVNPEHPMNNVEFIRQHGQVPRPTRGTIFRRTFLPWQLGRFAVINLKMIQMLHKCHNPPAARSTAGTGGAPPAS